MTIQNKAYKDVLVMKEDANGLWQFLHYPERQLLTNDELTLLKKHATNGWILITHPKKNGN